MSLGSWGEWVGSLAAIVPAVLWFFDRRDRKAAEDQLKELREKTDKAETESQARAIAGWIDSNGNFTLRNGSSLPIFDVRAGAMLYPVDDEPYGFDIGEWEALGPGDEVRDTDYRPPHVLTCYVKFRDSSGVRWERSSDGELRNLTDET
ncbi:hypothetical protein [Promicromonospora sp. NPDC050880]|uniref:hypothetical protein n=1 Tax=Promicromonospora sp. NPDC050880 TaxID=3364406 RepID=UPI0037AAAF1E